MYLKQQKKKHRGFLFLKKLKVNNTTTTKKIIKTILKLMKTLSMTTVVNKFVIDAKSKSTFKTLR